MGPERRIERLARRVRWLDRYRRVLALALTALVVPILLYALASSMPPSWPGAHLYAMSIALAVLAWYGIEVCVAGLLALWETDLAALERRDPLPRARLLARRK